MPPKTRNRVKRPAWTFSGITSAEWRTTPELVRWAQESREFRSLVTLLVNDRADVLGTLPPGTENCLLGRHQAYDAIRTHLLALADGQKASPELPTVPTYASDETTTSTDFND